MQAKKEILVLDDNDDMRELLVTVLSLKGYKVSAAKNIDLSAIKQKPDLILLDVLLTGKNGTDICAELKKDPFTRSIPVIMFSALHDARENCIRAGADEFILKPFKIQALYYLINNLLNRTAVQNPPKKIPA